MMYGFGWMGWWWPIMIVFWVAIIAFGIWAAKALFPTNSNSETTGGTALDTLKNRYANGEINKEEFEDARRLLEG